MKSQKNFGGQFSDHIFHFPSIVHSFFKTFYRIYPALIDFIDRLSFTVLAPVKQELGTNEVYKPIDGTSFKFFPSEKKILKGRAYNIFNGDSQMLQSPGFSAYSANFGHFNTKDRSVGNKPSLQLEWITASDVTGYSFILERSLNGVDWEPLVTFKPVAAGKNAVYNFMDIHFSEHRYHYRLRQVSSEGKSFYFSVAAVSIEEDIEVIPALISRGDFITVVAPVAECASVSLYNRNRSLWKKLDPIEGMVELPENVLTSGMYILEVSTSRGIVEKKLFLH